MKCAHVHTYVYGHRYAVNATCMHMNIVSCMSMSVVRTYVCTGTAILMYCAKDKYVSLGPVIHSEIGTHHTQGKAATDGAYVRTFRQLAIPTTTVLIITCKIFGNPPLSHDGQICWQMPPLP